MCNESLDIFKFSLKTILVENCARADLERKKQNCIFILLIVAGAEVSRSTDDQDVVTGGLQTNTK